MFICKQCLKDAYKWQADLMPSYGPCEDCGKVGPCTDGPWSLSVHSDSEEKAESKS